MDRAVLRMENIARGDLQKRNRTLKLVRRWQKRIWRLSADRVSEREAA